MTLQQARPFIEAAMARTYWHETWDDIAENVLHGRAQVWACDKAAAITEISRRRGGGRSLVVTYAGGDFAALMDMQKQAAAWGKAQGCDKMMVAGRKGWLRRLQNEGYRQAAVVLEREI